MNNFIALVAITVGSWIAVPGGAWSPSSELQGEVQAALKPYVVQQAAEQHRQLPVWSSYSFQYQGQVEAGKRIIYINAFCMAPPAYAKKEFVVVLDGGPCFFQVKYDPQKKEFFELMFNGVA